MKSIRVWNKEKTQEKRKKNGKQLALLAEGEYCRGKSNYQLLLTVLSANNNNTNNNVNMKETKTQAIIEKKLYIYTQQQKQLQPSSAAAVAVAQQAGKMSYESNKSRYWRIATALRKKSQPS